MRRGKEETTEEGKEKRSEEGEEGGSEEGEEGGRVNKCRSIPSIYYQLTFTGKSRYPN